MITNLQDFKAAVDWIRSSPEFNQCEFEMSTDSCGEPCAHTPQARPLGGIRSPDRARKNLIEALGDKGEWDSIGLHVRDKRVWDFGLGPDFSYHWHVLVAPWVVAKLLEPDNNELAEIVGIGTGP